MTSSIMALAILIKSFVARAYRQLSEQSRWVYVAFRQTGSRIGYAMPVFRCPEKQQRLHPL
ncbi:hypothetical protein UMM65_17285 [Aureibaculum sp. 2210JD6-5]|uniref:hypothetical protein n=1 Tax=Aureibaculum sp. 2210JD6-5 TaxID=3103957 RepID=UPI002AAC703E|nr:hypothetical protein [Aureibaculum sp. 2210JD6-5]MDY7397002.1 hypothetical protein [Aureibaculum sp. 2210JD6-5]